MLPWGQSSTVRHTMGVQSSVVDSDWLEVQHPAHTAAGPIVAVVEFATPWRKQAVHPFSHGACGCATASHDIEMAPSWIVQVRPAWSLTVLPASSSPPHATSAAASTHEVTN